MKKLIATIAVAVALSFAGSVVATDGAFAAKKPAMKSCQIGKGKSAQKWKCEPGQSCCVGMDGKGVCGMPGIGCL